VEKLVKEFKSVTFKDGIVVSINDLYYNNVTWNEYVVLGFVYGNGSVYVLYKKIEYSVEDLVLLDVFVGHILDGALTKR